MAKKNNNARVVELIAELKTEVDRVFKEWVNKHNEIYHKIDNIIAEHEAGGYSGVSPSLATMRIAALERSYERWMTTNLTNVGLVGVTDQLSNTPAFIEVRLK